MENKKGAFKEKRKKDLIFCLLVLAIPAIQFLIFYVGVNFNSILMAFQEYRVDENTLLGKYVISGFGNFKTIYNELKNEGVIVYALKNSLIVFSFNVLIGTTLSLVFSLYIYKRMIFSKGFRMFLFAPSVLSSIVTVTMYKYFVETAVPDILHFENGMGLLSNPDTKMQTLIFFMLWIGFGTQILMYSGSMNSIDQSVIEAAEIDGCNKFQEFFRIILPLIYPTIVTFMITNIAGLFTNQLNLYSFYGNGTDAKYQTVGYYLFRNVNVSTKAEMPVLAAYSILLTAVAAPLTLFFRWLLEKIGPKTE